MEKQIEEDDRSLECSECIRSSLVAKPRIVVWSALEASKNKLHKTTKKHQLTKNQITRGCLINSLIGFFTCLIGICSLIWKPYDLLMSERLEMRKGLPPYDWWANPPDEVVFSVYIFNVTNGQQFITGQSSKLHLEEVGPFVYREKLRHTNITVNENGTMFYTAVRTAEYLPELNTIDLNSKIVVPNIATLGMSSYLWNASFPIKFGFNLLMNQLRSEPLVTTTIQNYFWNFTDPLATTARSLVPFIIPKDNFGVLKQIYEKYSERVSVLIGKKNGLRKFFKIDSYNGRPGMGYWNNATCDSVQGSSEGVGYHQDIKRDDTLWYLRKAFCRAAPLHYTGDHVMSGMTIFKFELANDTFNRPSDGNDCYLQDGIPSLPSGFTDASPCYYNLPLATSFPHLMMSEPAATEKIAGLKPNYTKHYSYIDVEPNTGVPMTAVARIQSNLVIRPIRSGFPKLKRFYNMTIPMFWAEYKQVGLPRKIIALTYFTVIIVQGYQTYFSVLMLVLAMFHFYKAYQIKTKPTSNQTKQPEPASNTLLGLENK